MAPIEHGLCDEARVDYALTFAIELKRATYRRLLLRLIEDMDTGLPMDAIERRLIELVATGTGQ
jgi:hypothetical protein